MAFGRLAAHNLANYRPWSNDEGELLAVGYKLATRGVLGSDVAIGFFGSDQHFLETLPLQFVLQAIPFRLIGPGILQARAVSLVAALTIIWTTGWLALRWYGVAVALVCEALLTLWRSNLTGVSSGLPLLEQARTARYDVLAVAGAWLTIAALDATLRKPSVVRGLVTGVCAGVTALSQFFGVFVVPLVVLAWMMNPSRGLIARAAMWTVVGFALTIAPYVVFAAYFRADLVGQLTAAYGERGNVLAPVFFLNNLLGEPARYAHLVFGWPPAPDVLGNELSDAPLSPWLLVVGFWPALTFVIWRARRPGATGDRLLVFALACFGGLLWLLDQTKTELYAVALLPPVSICLSAGGVALVTWLWGRRRDLLTRGLISAGVAAVCGIAVMEGAHAYAVDWAQAASVTPYLPLGEQIDAALAQDAPLLGPERWWWALRAHPYVSLRSIWFEWTALKKTGASPQFADWVVQMRPDSIIVNINIRNDLEAFPPDLQEQFWSFMDRCTIETAEISNPNYFNTEIYKVVPGCR